MTQAKDLTGQRFGKLVAVSRHSKAGKRWRWLCVCDCGRKSLHRVDHLTSGHCTSCGCLKLALGRTLINQVVTRQRCPHGEQKLTIEGDI